MNPNPVFRRRDPLTPVSGTVLAAQPTLTPGQKLIQLVQPEMADEQASREGFAAFLRHYQDNPMFEYRTDAGAAPPEVLTNRALQIYANPSEQAERSFFGAPASQKALVERFFADRGIDTPEDRQAAVINDPYGFMLLTSPQELENVEMSAFAEQNRAKRQLLEQDLSATGYDPSIAEQLWRWALNAPEEPIALVAEGITPVGGAIKVAKTGLVINKAIVNNVMTPAVMAGVAEGLKGKIRQDTGASEASITEQVLWGLGGAAVGGGLWQVGSRIIRGGSKTNPKKGGTSEGVEGVSDEAVKEAVETSIAKNIAPWKRKGIDKLVEDAENGVEITPTARQENDIDEILSGYEAQQVEEIALLRAEELRDPDYYQARLDEIENTRTVDELGQETIGDEVAVQKAHDDFIAELRYRAGIPNLPEHVQEAARKAISVIGKERVAVILTKLSQRATIEGRRISFNENAIAVRKEIEGLLDEPGVRRWYAHFTEAARHSQGALEAASYRFHLLEDEFAAIPKAEAPDAGKTAKKVVKEDEVVPAKTAAFREAAARKRYEKAQRKATEVDGKQRKGQIPWHEMPEKQRQAIQIAYREKDKIRALQQAEDIRKCILGV